MWGNSNHSGQLELNPMGKTQGTIQNMSDNYPMPGRGCLSIYAPVTRDPCWRDAPRWINSAAFPATAVRKVLDTLHRERGPCTPDSARRDVKNRLTRSTTPCIRGAWPQLCLPLLTSPAQEVEILSDSNSGQRQAPV